MKQRILAVSLVLIILVGASFWFKQDPNVPLDEAYINTYILNQSNLLYGTDLVDSILIHEEIAEDRLLLCSTENGNIMLILLDKDRELLRRTTFDYAKLNNNSSDVKSVDIPLSGNILHYNLFLNPTGDSIVFNGNNMDVYIFEQNCLGVKYRLGFWFDFENAIV